MTTIRDIYQWCDNSYENAPHPPRDLNLTPLQLLEWEKQNSKAIEDYKNISFVGEKLYATPALIQSIKFDKILAGATYLKYFAGQWFGYGQYSSYKNLFISYELFFDKTLYETVKRVYNNSWIEFEGEILSFEYLTSEGYDFDNRIYNLKIKLSGIAVISEPSLSPSLLGVKPIPNQTQNSSKCFIATAAFGHQDLIEVIQLREFRNNVLRNSFVGRCFISVYGILSPPFALVIRQSNWLRKITRMFLIKVVLPWTNKNKHVD